MKVKDLLMKQDSFIKKLSPNDSHYYQQGYDIAFSEISDFLRSGVTFKQWLKITGRIEFDPNWFILLSRLNRANELEEEWNDV